MFYLRMDSVTVKFPLLTEKLVATDPTGCPSFPSPWRPSINTQARWVWPVITKPIRSHPHLPTRDRASKPARRTWPGGRPGTSELREERKKVIGGRQLRPRTWAGTPARSPRYKPPGKPQTERTSKGPCTDHLISKTFKLSLR